MIEQQDNIKKYLTNKMTEDERQAFEVAMVNDKELAKEVDFNKDLMDFLNDDNPELEAMLTGLGNKYAAKSAAKSPASTIISTDKEKDSKENTTKSDENNKQWLFWLIGIIVVILAFWLIRQATSRSSDTSTSTEINTTQQKDKDTNAIKEVSEPTPIVPTQESKTNQTEIDSKTPKVPVLKEDFTPKGEGEPTRSIKAPQPMANLEKAYTPNRDLEILVADGIRSSNLVFELNQPQGFYTFYQKNGQVKITLDGTINQNIPLELIIYDNNRRSFNQNRPVLKTDMRVQPNGNEFQFNFTADTTMPKGLYYFLIYNKNNKEMLAISKFSVK